MAKIPRVIHIFGQMNRGGAETRTMEIYRNIERQKVQFDFIVTKPGNHDYFNEIKELGGRIFYIDPPSSVGFINHAKQLKLVLEKEGPFYAIHAHTSFNEGIALSVAKKVGIKHRIAHSRSASNANIQSIKGKIYAFVMRKLIVKNATDLVTCGTEAGYYLFGKKAMEKGKVYRLPNAINLKEFEIDEKQVKAIKDELGIKNTTIVIGNVGNLRTVKNHMFLLDVFYHFKSKIPDSVLLIAGSGGMESNLVEKISKLELSDSVKLLGLRKDIPYLMNCFNAFVLPSLYEGVPGVIVEAQAAGLPCLISDSVTRDVDVGTGLLNYISLSLPPQYWASYLEKIIVDKGKSNHEYINILKSSGFDVTSSVEKLMSIYNLQRNESIL